MSSKTTRKFAFGEDPAELLETCCRVLEVLFLRCCAYNVRWYSRRSESLCQLLPQMDQIPNTLVSGTSMATGSTLLLSYCAVLPTLHASFGLAGFLALPKYVKQGVKALPTAPPAYSDENLLVNSLLISWLLLGTTTTSTRSWRAATSSSVDASRWMFWALEIAATIFTS